MWQLIVVSLFWGITNPFLKSGGSKLDENMGIMQRTISLYSNLSFFIPFVVNQCGSLIYYYSLGLFPISLAIPLVNSCTLFLTLSGLQLFYFSS
ncbi:unnamed protein product [Oikopleura dioica]|uniref:Transmembrane protein 234 n=1 Tax=Oikopleura dioica TaxID=34765 RepID=E4XG18_OIKDI|nr:unnamed protein product [Oikopleura dioica]